jgi:hypothetical protein
MAFTSGTQSSTILLKQSEINFDLFDLWDERDRVDCAAGGSIRGVTAPRWLV